jgi:hypothetical protein
MDGISDWRAKARFILKRETSGISVLMCPFGKLPKGVLYDVMEHTAALLRERDGNSYDVFIGGVDSAYEIELKSIAKEKARTAKGDPAALIRFPGKGGA